MTRLLGYCDRWSAAPGERVRFMVSCEGAAEYRADLVRLHSARLGPDAPPFREEEIDAPINGRYPARTQAIHAGSFAIVDPAPSLPAPGSFTLQAWVWPTMPGDRPHVPVILAISGWPMLASTRATDTPHAVNASDSQHVSVDLPAPPLAAVTPTINPCGLDGSET